MSDDSERIVSVTDIHITAMAIHCALTDQAARDGISNTAHGHHWDPGARDGWIDLPTTRLAEALLRAGFEHPPPALS